MFYRIKKTVDFDGVSIFVPQFKKFLIYWDFWETSFPPHKVFFRTYEQAKHFIQIQKEKPAEEFYNV